MRNNNGTIAKSDAMSVAKAGRVYIKNNNGKNRGGGDLLPKLWWALALASLLFAFGCK